MEVRPFISYAREDRDIARRLYRDLSKCGSQPWLDIENLLGGQDWQRTISSAIRESSHFLALISHRSVSKRGFVQREVAEALRVLELFPPDEVFVIPVRLDDAQPKHERLAQLQRIDMFPSYDDGLQQLIKSLGLIGDQRSVVEVDTTHSAILQLPSADPADEPSDRNVVPVSALRALARDRDGFLTSSSVATLVLERSQGNPSLITAPLLLLKNASQQTWLVFTKRIVACVLDDIRKGELYDPLRWECRHDVALPVTVEPHKPMVGVIHLGSRHQNWLYSTDLHPNPGQLKDRVEQLIQHESGPS
jgi:hypothetical protein